MKPLVLLPLLATAAVPIAASAASGPPSRAELSQFSCQTALAPIARVVSVRAVMRPVPGTRAMAVRFELLTKTSSRHAYAQVPGGDLGKWLSPTDPVTLGQDPNDIWIISHPVANLPAPASYRYKVSFRWTGAHGVLATVTQFSAVCFEPDLRPDLLVRKITVTPISATSAKYVAVIGNTGASAANVPFQVTLTAPGGYRVAPVTIRRLGAHRLRSATFVGPNCTTAGAPTVTVDPARVVDELNIDNNSLRAKCTAAPDATRPSPVVGGVPLHSVKQ
jgi:hypothetical protein